MTSGSAEARPLLYLDRATVERLLEVDPLLDAIAAAFVEVSGGRSSVPPRVAATAPAGLLAAMPGYVPGTGLAAKLVTVFADNEAAGMPSHQAVIALFDPATGRPQAIMDGTHITAVRTAVAAALSVRLLARRDARVLAVLGAGVQGEQHLRAMPHVRPFEEIRIASRNPEKARALAATDPRARVEPFEAAVRGADVVSCCTGAPSPVLRREWLAAGAHVTSVGWNPAGPELDAATILNGRLFVESRTAFAPSPAGAVELAGLDPALGTELGEVIGGSAEGRRSDGEITVYKSMGHAAEDAAAARLVYDRALELGAGVRLEL